MIRKFWIPSKDQSQVFKGLHSAMVEAASPRRRSVAHSPWRWTFATQLAAATVAAGAIFAAGYWCGSQGTGTAARSAVARPAPVTHEMMVRSVQQPDGPRRAASRAANQPQPPAQPRREGATTASQRPGSGARPQTRAAQSPARVGRPREAARSGSSSVSQRSTPVARPGSMLPQPGRAAGGRPHAARAAAGTSDNRAASPQQGAAMRSRLVQPD